jgi:hypothetical protein
MEKKRNKKENEKENEKETPKSLTTLTSFEHQICLSKKVCSEEGNK